MRVITRRESIRDNITRWISTFGPYPADQPMQWTQGVPLGVYADRIKALDPDTATVAQVRAANDRVDLTMSECDECGRDCDILIHIGDEPDYDARWQDLCVPCLNNAISLAQPKPRNPPPMTTMLERVARAIAGEYGDRWEYLPEVTPPNGDTDKALYYALARAAILAMRPASPYMIMSTPI